MNTLIPEINLQNLINSIQLLRYYTFLIRKIELFRRGKASKPALHIRKGSESSSPRFLIREGKLKHQLSYEFLQVNTTSVP